MAPAGNRCFSGADLRGANLNMANLISGGESGYCGRF
jgi:hypothetical protein